MAKKNKKAAHNASILFADDSETPETQKSNQPGNRRIMSVIDDNSVDNSMQDEKPKSFWSGLGRGERIGAVAVCLLLALGALGAGLGDKIISVFNSKNPKQTATNQPAQTKNSYLSTLNPFVEPPPPAPTPQLSKEYIYAGSRMLAVEDANANAAPPADIAVWRPSTGYWYVLGGQGSAPTSVAWGQIGDTPVAGDFDGDGKTDFSVFRPSGTSGTWYVSNSSNGYTVGQTFGANNDRVAPADYDGDGRTDMAVFRDQSPNGWWYVSRSTDSGTTSFQFGLGSDTPAPKDYDGDGHADFAVWRGSTKTFYIMRSSDNQVQSITLPSPATDGLPVCGDYDGDGKADAAIKSNVSGNNNWYIMPSSGGAMQTVPWQNAGDIPVQNDYDGDGKVDIAVWRASIGWWFIRQSSHLGQSNELRQEQWGGTINGVADIPVPAYYRR